jgi:hypothetical protein
MTEWLLVVDVAVDPSVEQQWNNWYDTKHLPEIVDCPGFLSGARYRAEDEAGPRYLTIYELSGPEALESDEFRNRRGWRDFSSHVQPKVRLYRCLTKRSGR